METTSKNIPPPSLSSYKQRIDDSHSLSKSSTYHRKKNSQKLHFWSFLENEAVKKIFRQNPNRHY